VSLLNYSRETIKERMGSWLGTAQRCKGVTEGGMEGVGGAGSSVGRS